MDQRHRGALTVVGESSPGFSLLELLVGLLVLGFLSLAAAAAFRLSAQLERRLQGTREADAKIAYLERILQRGLGASRVRYAVPGARFHHDGLIKDIRGVLHPIHRRNSAVRPREETSAVSFLVLESDWYLRRRAPLRWCEESRPTGSAPLPEPSAVREWIAVGIDGFVQVRARVRRVRSGDWSCPAGRAYRGAVERSSAPMFGRLSVDQIALPAVFRPQLEEKLSSAALLLLPIQQAYTVYLDQAGRLRQLSHTTQENQPLAYDFDRLVFRTERGADAELLAIIRSLSGPHPAGSNSSNSRSFPIALPAAQSIADVLF